MIELLITLDDCFRDIIYYDKWHKYFINNKECISVSTIIKKYKKPFDSDYQASKKAKERGVTKQEILDEWDYKRDRQSIKGKILHSYIENKLANKIFPYDNTEVIKRFGNDPVLNDFEILSKQSDKFISDIKGKMIPIKSEFIVGDESLGLCGTIDQIFYNKRSNKFEIWDWKQNENLTTSSQYKLTKSLSHLDSSDLSIYSIQLSLYKAIIEMKTGIEFGDNYLVWFNESQPTYKCIKCHDYSHEASIIFEELRSKM
jgi:hypothetical protein